MYGTNCQLVSHIRKDGLCLVYLIISKKLAVMIVSNGKSKNALLCNFFHCHNSFEAVEDAWQERNEVSQIG